MNVARNQVDLLNHLIVTWLISWLLFITDYNLINECQLFPSCWPIHIHFHTEETTNNTATTLEFSAWSCSLVGSWAGPNSILRMSYLLPSSAPSWSFCLPRGRITWSCSSPDLVHILRVWLVVLLLVTTCLEAETFGKYLKPILLRFPPYCLHVYPLAEEWLFFGLATLWIMGWSVWWRNIPKWKVMDHFQLMEQGERTAAAFDVVARGTLTAVVANGNRSSTCH